MAVRPSSSPTGFVVVVVLVVVSVCCFVVPPPVTAAPLSGRLRMKEVLRTPSSGKLTEMQSLFRHRRRHPAVVGVDPASIAQVHVVFMNHLDVGFSNGLPPYPGLAYGVLSKYFTEYFPRAVQTAATLRQQSTDRYVYTTHAWLLDLLFDCPSGPLVPGTSFSIQCPTADTVSAVKDAILRGDITWHAGAFNQESELMTQGLFKFSVDGMAHRLDHTFQSMWVAQNPGLPVEDSPIQLKNTMSQRDVPGLTAAVIPTLSSLGVKAISVGVNGASAPPDVPQIFRWQYQSSPSSSPSSDDTSEVYAMWHPGGYGGVNISDCVLIDGFSQTLCFAFRTDNSGPHTPDEVIGIFKQLRSEFPNAQVNASTFDAFVSQLDSVKGSLPVFTGEIGDNWIYGVSSDPKKLAVFREIQRARDSCIQQATCDPTSYEFHNFSRLLIKGAEHTWGADFKQYVNDYANWSNPLFNAARKDPAWNVPVYSWLEQRGFIDQAVQALPQGSAFRQDLEDRLKNIMNPVVPSPEQAGYSQIPLSAIDTALFETRNVQFRISSSTGFVVSVLDKLNKKNITNNGRGFFELRYETRDELAFKIFESYYAYCPWSICTWADRDFGKPNMTLADPESRLWDPVLNELWLKNVSGELSLLWKVTFDSSLPEKYGAPEYAWFQMSTAGLSMSVDLLVFQKTPTRLTESMYLSFEVKTMSNPSLHVEKLDQWIDVTTVVRNGSQNMHGFSNSLKYSSNDYKIVFSSLDAGLAVTGLPTCFPALIPRPTYVPNIVSFNLWNNCWGTNYILWYPYVDADANGLYRFVVDFGAQ